MQNVSLEPGKYIVAVSGGVDSVVLLDALSQLSDVELVVAHVDHGVRPDSHEDTSLVRSLAEKYNVPIEVTSLELGPNASEAIAREQRYTWLETVRAKYDADAIVTAHHQNDVIETMFINMLRGTGWRGLASLRETQWIRRPLLDTSKIEVVTYAINHDLSWREDSTNDDVRYLRNYIRHGIMPRLDQQQLRKLIDLYRAQCRLRDEVEAEAARVISHAASGNGLRRYWLAMLPDDAARELLRQKFGSLTREQSTRLLHFAKTGQIGSVLELSAAQTYRATRQLIALETPNLVS